MIAWLIQCHCYYPTDLTYEALAVSEEAARAYCRYKIEEGGEGMWSEVFVGCDSKDVKKFCVGAIGRCAYTIHPIALYDHRDGPPQ